MRYVAAALALIGLTGCGVDGEPKRPELSGNVTMGVGSDGDVRVRTRTTLANDRFGVSLDL
ncbi:hypothetical protein [Actibacterium sp. 188UL27-1]|uniref:hypothetical protein n=1 Tax=Actibacterium sp. 188UL27-1 TaxID=2786961 RepID=UPI001958A74A|nr:hypothetical protein [Actibacterium sp. 188UL27-1]MBM7066322.1 hypothetical protein [Actibacterium sp. 188UL27-1]